MRKYEYKVVPVPAKCVSTRGAAKDTDPAAHTIELILNDLGIEGWEYLRTDRVTIRDGGIFGRGEVAREMLVFRRHPVALTDRETDGWTSAAKPAVDVPRLPSPEEIRARKVKRPELLEGARAGRRRITPRPALMDLSDKADKHALAAE